MDPRSASGGVSEPFEPGKALFEADRMGQLRVICSRYGNRSMEEFTSIVSQITSHMEHDLRFNQHKEPQQYENELRAFSIYMSYVPPQYRLEALFDNCQTFLVVLYSLTAIASFLLNVITVVVLARSKGSELRKYLMNLSFSDLIMSLLSIPVTYTEYMLGRWVLPVALCPVVRLAVTMSVFVSSATMTVIGVNRHFAIMYPLRSQGRAKVCGVAIRKTHVIILIWLVGLLISVPEYLMADAQPFCFQTVVYWECRSLWSSSDSYRYTIFIFVSTFALPLSVLSYFYTNITMKLMNRQMPGEVDVNRDQTMHMKRVKVIKMLVVVVAVFALAWLPLQMFIIAMYHFPEARYLDLNVDWGALKYKLFVVSYFIAHWLAMAHSCFNPLIYCFMNDKFRSELKDMLRRNWRRRRQQHRLHLDSYSQRTLPMSWERTTRNGHQSMRLSSSANQPNLQVRNIPQSHSSRSPGGANRKQGATGKTAGVTAAAAATITATSTSGSSPLASLAQVPLAVAVSTPLATPSDTNSNHSEQSEEEKRTQILELATTSNGHLDSTTVFVRISPASSSLVENPETPINELTGSSKTCRSRAEQTEDELDSDDTEDIEETPATGTCQRSGHFHRPADV